MGLYLSVSALYTDEKGEDVNDILFREIGLRGHRRLPRSMAIRKSGKNQVLFIFIQHMVYEAVTLNWAIGYGDSHVQSIMRGS